METIIMKRSAAGFLQAVVVLFGLAILTFLLWEPHVEGRNAHATVREIYFQDPFLAYVYVGSIPFFVAIYRAFGLLGHLSQSGTHSPATVGALRSIQRCALTLLAFVAGGVVIILINGDPDDRPAGVFMSLLVTVPTVVVATLAAKFARKVQAGLGRGE
jgi:cyanate permease